ncbi:MAG: hypothetical protein CO189_02050 [candidate division Zixibacteria bacterium CG_4_9_14_3_um_filter_46_8]|nr:MAG: hypothetical protein CO189_02050 [candidate division Zixibacteria bacterium CG_4_9_14_3_um_filter_46_8]
MRFTTYSAKLPLRNVIIIRGGILRKPQSIFILVFGAILVMALFASCDKEAAERRIFSDPVMKASLLEKMMADESMMEAMIDHSLSDQILSDTILGKIMQNEQLRARILSKAFADSLALQDIIFRVNADKNIRDRITERK